MKFVYDDGGRKLAGYKGKVGDCVVRSISIATKKSYQEIYDLVDEFSKKEYHSKKRGEKSSSRTGVYSPTVRRIMKHLEWDWIPIMNGAIYLNKKNLPKGRIICSLSYHITAVINGIIYDRFDPNKKKIQRVYGYYIKN